MRAPFGRLLTVGAWAHFPPIVAVEQFIDRAHMYRGPHTPLECLMNRGHGHEGTRFGLLNKGRQEGFLISPTQRGVKPTPR
jgi:hypothetical protein